MWFRFVTAYKMADVCIFQTSWKVTMRVRLLVVLEWWRQVLCLFQTQLEHCQISTPTKVLKKKKKKGLIQMCVGANQSFFNQAQDRMRKKKQLWGACNHIPYSSPNHTESTDNQWRDALHSWRYTSQQGHAKRSLSSALWIHFRSMMPEVPVIPPPPHYSRWLWAVT